MLIVGTDILNTPVMSLQTGTELARIVSPIINPYDLTIIAYELDGPLLDTHPSYLRVADIREIGEIGIIIDSSDEFIQLDDVIKIREIHDLDFDLIGLSVASTKKQRLGKVENYTFDLGSFTIQQLTVRRPIFKSLGDTELLVHRSQIVEINNQKVIVKSGTVNAEPIKSTIRTYTNPFRGTGNAQPETIDAHES